MISSRPTYFSLNNQSIWRKKLVAWAMLILMTTQPMTSAAEVVADSKAPGGNRPLVENSANGLPIVQITQPSAAGISRNQYQQFNVDSRGLILNNSGIITQTQLAGYITGNPFIGHGPSARIILNEVTSKNPSYLRGYTEVAGQKADIIIANPNGIYGDGFGFINTNRAVLTTGTPVFGGSGSLDAFRVSGGQISIQGAGMNAANVDQVDLISRSVAINAQVWAKNLNVVAGSNKVDYKTMGTETITSDAASPQVAIDVGQLGGMYAQKIYMVGTENGLGVNSKGTIAAQAGDITITSAGKVLLANTSATGNIQVAAAEGVTNQKTLYAQGYTNITTLGTLNNSGILAAKNNTNITAHSIESIGVIGAGVQNSGTLGTTGNLTVNAAGTIAMNGQNLAAGDLKVTGSALSLANSKTLTGGNANLTATLGDMDHSKGSLQVNGALNVTAQGTIRNDNGNIEAEKLSLIAHSFSNRTGVITQLGKETTTIKTVEGVDNTAGVIASNGGSLQIKSNALTNSQGQIQHAGTGGLSVETAGNIKNNDGKLATNGLLKLSAQNLDNTKGKMIVQKQIGITVQGDVNNQEGDIEASQEMTLTAQSLNNKNGRLANLGGGDMLVTVEHEIQNQSGIFGGNGKVDIAAQALSTQDGRITAQKDLTILAAKGIDSNLISSDIKNTGVTASGGNLTLTTTGKVVLSGKTSAGGDIKLHAQDGLSNYSSLYAEGDTRITTKGALESTNSIISKKNTTLKAQSIKLTDVVGAGIQKDGTLGTTGNLLIDASENIAMTGENLAAGDLVITGSSLDLKHSETVTGGNGNLTATAGDIDHGSGTMQVGGTLNVSAKGEIRNDKGDIRGRKLNLTAHAIDNQSGTITQLGQEATTIHAVKEIDNRGGILASNGTTLAIKADSLVNSQGQIQHAGTGALSVETTGDVKNDDGKLATNGQLQLKAQNIDNTKGKIVAQKQVNLAAQAAFDNNQGILVGSDAVSITAQGAVNNQLGNIEASKGMTLTAESLENQKGRLVSLDDSGMLVTAKQGIENQSGTIGGNGKVDLIGKTLSNQDGRITAQGNLTITATDGIDSNLTSDEVQQTGVIASGGDMTVTSIGKTLLSGNTSADGDIKIHAQDGLINYGTLYAEGNTEIKTQGALENSDTVVSGQNLHITAQAVNSSGTMGAGIQNDGTLGTTGDLTIHAVEDITMTGKNLAAGNMTVTGSSLNLKNSKTVAGDNGNLTATAGDIDHGSGTMQVGGTLNVSAKGEIRNDKGDIRGGKLNLTANAIRNGSGTITQLGQEATTIHAVKEIDNRGGILASNGTTLAIKADSLVNSQGQIQHAGTGTLSVETAGDVKNDDGKLATNGQLQLTVQNLDNTKGKIIAQKQVNVAAQAAFNNNQGILVGSDAVSIAAQGAVNNQLGNIEASKGMTLTAESLENQKGRLVSLDDSGMLVTAKQGIENQSGTIGGNGKVDLIGKTLSNQDGRITAQGNLTITATDGIDSNLTSDEVQQTGVIASGGDMTVTSIGKTLLSGNTSADGDIKIHAQDGLINYGTLYAEGNTEIKTQGALENSDTVVSGQNLHITAQTVNSSGTMGAGIQNDGTLGTTGDLTIHAVEDITMTGKNLAAGNMTVTGSSLNLKNSKTVAGGNANLNAAAGDIDHKKGSLKVGGVLQATAQGDIHNDNGDIYGGNINLTAQAIDNHSGTITQLGQEATSLHAVKEIDNKDGIIATNGTTLEIKADSLVNSQGQIQHAGTGALSVETAGDVKNDDGKLATNGQLQLTVQNLDNTKGKIIAQKQVNLAAQAAFNNNQGILVGSDAVSITAQGAVNNQLGNIEASKGMTLTAESLENQKGRLVNLGDSGMLVTVEQGIQNQSGTIGGNGMVDLAAQALHTQDGRITAQGNLSITATDGIDSNLTSDEVQDTGVIASGGDVTIASSGKTILSGSISAENNIQIHTKDGLSNYSKLYGKGNADITTQGVFENIGVIATGENTTLNAQKMTSIGTIATGIQSDGTIGSSGDLAIAANEAVNMHGKSIVAGNLTVQAAAVDLTGSKTTIGNHADVNAKAGGVNNSGASLWAGGELDIKAVKGTIRNDKDIKSKQGEITAGKITLVADSISNRGGSITQLGQENTSLVAAGNIDNIDGEIATNGLSFQIQADSLSNNHGTIEHAGAGHLLLETSEDMDNSHGKVASNGDITMQVQGIDNNNGKIKAQKKINMTAEAALKNEQGMILSGENIQIDIQGNIDNQYGSIEANKGLEVNAQDLNNQNGRIVNRNDSGAALKIKGQIQNQSGLIGGTGNVDIIAQKLVNESGQVIANQNLTITTPQGIDNTTGTLFAQENLTLMQNNGDINNTKGGIGAGNNLVVQAAAVNNRDGKLVADNTIKLTAQSLSGDGKAVAGQDLDITLGSDFTNDAGHELKANRDIHLVTSGMVNNKGSIVAVQNGTINASAVTNVVGGVLAAGDSLQITAPGDIINRGQIVGGDLTTASRKFDNTAEVVAEDLTITADNITNEGNAAVIKTEGDAKLFASTTLLNKDGGKIYSKGSIVMAGSQRQDANGNYLDRTNMVLNQSSSIEAAIDSRIYANKISNKKTDFAVEKRETNTQKNEELASWAGDIKAASREYTETVVENVITKDSAPGKIVAGQNMVLKGDLDNGTSVISAGGTLEIEGDTVTNSGYANTRTVTKTGKDTHVVGQEKGSCKKKTLGGKCKTYNMVDVKEIVPYNVETVDVSSGVSAIGRIEGGTVKVTSQNLNNSGVIIADNLAISTGKMKNESSTALVAATQNTAIYANDALENKDGATIYSMGNLIIAGGKDKEGNLKQAGSVLNQSATIEAEDDVGIYAGQITNKKRQFAIEKYQTSKVQKEETIPIRANYKKARRTYIESIVETVATKDSASGQIIAGQNMELKGAIENNVSTITAGGTLDFDSETVNNIGYGNTRFTSRSGSDIYTRSERYCKHRIMGHCRSHGRRDVNDSTPYKEEFAENLPGYPAIFTANKRITGQAVTVNNKTITLDGAPIGSTATTVTPEQNIGTDVAATVTPGPNIGAPIKNVSGTGMPQQNVGNMTVAATMQTGQNNSVAVNSASDTGLPQQTAGNMTGLVGTIVQSGQNSGVPVNNAGGTGVPQQTAGNIAGIAGSIAQTGQNSSTPVENISGTESPQKPVIPVVPGKDSTSSIPKSNNEEVKASNRDLSNKEFSLPTSGLYTVHTEPGKKYLVETDPHFANYRNFLSSDYMLEKLAYDPEKTQKRLGDAFYEQKVINEQILELTGKRYLDGFTSNEEEYKHLLNNGVTYAKEFSLQPGIALTAEQIAKLTSDMVWLVEEEVQGQKVLVPVVYLAQTRDGDLKPSGALMAADNIQIKATGDLTNGGVIKAKDQLQLTAGNIINRGGTIDSAKDLQLKADQDILNQSGSIKGGQVNLNAGRDIKNETLVSTVARDAGFTTMVNQQASISSSQGLTLKADQDILMSGGQVKAVQDVTLEAGRNLDLASAEHKERVAFAYGSTKYEKDATTNIVSTIGAGGNVNLTAQGDATLQGMQVNAGKDLTLTAGGNVNVTNVTDRVLDDLGSKGRASYLRNKTDQETVIGSNLTADKNIKVEAVEKIGTNQVIAPLDHGNITIEGSTIKSKTGGITVTADQNITVTGTTERQEILTESRIVSEGFLSKKVKEKRDQEILNAVKSSTISGETVEIKAGKDLTIQASNVVGTNDVKLSATDTIHLVSQDETGKADHYSYTKKSGLFGGGGFGFTIGSKSEKTTTKEQTLGAVGSTIGSEKGNIFITAGDKVNSAGTTFISGNDLNITGKDVTIDNTINTYDSQTKYEFKQSGLSVSVGGGAVATATKAVGNLERAGQVQDDRLKALYDYKAVKDLKDLNKELKNGINKESLGASVNVSIGSSKMTSEQTVHTETVNTSNINAGGNVVIKGTEEDVTLKGTKINAKDITIDAAKDITLGSGENKQETDSKTSSSSWSVGGSIGANAGYFGNVSKGSGKEHENATTHTGSTLDASGTLTLKSGEDTNIKGSQAKGEKVVADIKGNLNIASQQDTDDYTAKNKNSGIGFSTGKTGGVTGSIGKGKTDSTYTSVTEQAGIVAGKDGFDITVGKNTDLKGAVISSDATPDKNKLSTGTLTYSDIQNHAEYDSSSVGVNVDTTKDAKYNEKGVTPNIGVTAKGDADSTTKSAIAEGTIEVRSNPNQDLSKLSRDTTHSLNTLGKIFDKQTVQEQKELASLFGELAFKKIGDLGLKEGSPERVALGIFAGGLMAKLGGGSFASGAAGTGFNQILMNELTNITDPALRQWASALVGAVAAKLVGGDANTGASTAVSETKNNNEAHEVLQKMLAERRVAMATERADKFEQLDSDYNVWTDLHNNGEISDQAYEYIQDQYGKTYNKIYAATDPSISFSGDGVGGFITGFAGIPGMVLGDVVFNPGTAEAASLGQMEIGNLMQDTSFLDKFMNYGTRAKQYVYVLKDNEGVVKYVGRSDDPVRRAAEHSMDVGKAGLHMDVLTENPISFAEGRGLEQYVYEQFGGKDKLRNKIRPVNTDKTWGQFLLNLGEKAFKRLNL